MTSSPPIPQPLTAPPRPRVVFRIGVTGHRPNRLNPSRLPELEATIERLLREALAHLAQHATPDDAAPVLRVLCCLAEGADRLVARIALRLGCDLQVVLPFLRADYESDFTAPGSLEDFRSLLIHASAVLELGTQTLSPHTRDRSFAYRDAGDTLLNQSDLLLALWDGQPAAGIGGTIDVLEHAESRGIPALLIDPNSPATITVSPVSEPLTTANATAALADIINQTVTLSSKHFFWSEPRPTHNATTSFTLLRLLGDYKLRRAPRPQPDLCALDLRTPPLCPYFGWTDTLAVHYGERSRSAGLRLQLLASLAVLCALLRIPSEESITLLRLLSITEMAAILVLLLTAARVATTHWHERWLFYRSLAEQVRCLDILLPLAQSLPAPPVLGFMREEDSRTNFANRYILAIAREVGLLAAVADAAFLDQRLAILKQIVATQADFHSSAAKRYDRVQKLLHRSGMALFIAAIALCLYELLRAFMGPAGHNSWLATTSAILPALGAAAASVAAQSELKRLAGRSAAMSQTLRETLTQVARLTPPTLRSVIAVSRRIAEILTSEVRDWRVLVASKRPEIPT